MGIFKRIFGGKDSPDAFASKVMQGITRAGETRRILYQADQFRIRPDDAADATILNLHNFYHEYQAAEPSQRDAVIRHVVKGWFYVRKEMPDSYEDVGHDLLPAIRSRSYLEFMKLQLVIEGADRFDIPHIVVGEHLALCLVYDLPDSMRMIRQVDLDNWGTTIFEAFELAHENLAKLPISVGELPDGAYFLCSGDEYDATRMIMLNLIGQLKIEGDPVVIPPARGQLLIAGTGSEAGLAAIAAIAAETLREPRPLTGIAFRLDGEHWALWLPPREHVAFRPFKQLELQSLGQDYSEQKGFLEKLQELRREDVFVATYSGMESPTGELNSYSVWAKGVPTLLPKTNILAFMQDGVEPVMAEWDHASEIVGRLMQPQGMYPERYRVDQFPTLDELARLARQA